MFLNLLDELPEIPEDGILSRSILKTPAFKVILFAFAAGQELSEHTSAHEAVLHFLQGEATVTLGEDVHTAQPHTWVHMPANLPHSILAKTPVIMLLIMTGG